MANPIPGQNYTVVNGDWLRTIAARAYGDQWLWPKIYNANVSVVGKNPHRIYPGQVLFIPPLEEKIEQQEHIEENRIIPAGKSVVIYIDGREYPAKQGRFAWAIDTMASSFNAEFVWNPGKNEEFDKATARGSFAQAQLYLLGNLVCTGHIYTRTATITTSEIKKSCVFYSKTKDVVDTYLSANHREFSGSNLQQIVDIILEVLGYQAEYLDSPGKVFENLEGIPLTETVGKFFQKLAASRGLFVSCDEKGKLIFQKLKTDTDPIAFIEYPGRIAQEWSHTYDDTTRFHNYVAVSKSSDGKKMQSKGFIDPNVPGTRQYIFSSDDNALDGLDYAAEWFALCLNLNAATLRVPVSTWTDDQGNLWTPNTAVSVKSPVLDVKDTRKMIIRGVEFEFSADNRTAVLSLVPVLKVEDGKLIMEDA